MGKTVVHLFWERLAERKHRTLLRFRGNGYWEDISWNLAAEKIRQLAGGLLENGLKKGGRVAILSHNRHEWFLADMAILSAGGVSVPIYPTLLAKECRYILSNCNARFIFVENKEQCEKILSVWQKLPKLKQVFVFEDIRRKQNIYQLEDLKDRGKRFLKRGKRIEDIAKTVQPNDLASLVYTSGTTGPPKGSMLLHKNLFFICQALEKVWPFKEGDVHLSYLPIAHVYERLAGHFFVMAAGGVIAYARSLETIAEDAQVVKPTIFLGVPRIYEKIAQRIQENIKKSPPLQQAIFQTAMKIGQRAIPYRESGRIMPVPLRLQWEIANMLVYTKLRKRLGGKVEYLISAAAPLSKELQLFFQSLGFFLLEAYGLTETTAPATINLPNAYKIGTVGKPLPGVKLKIAKDGEILLKGPNIFAGYYKNSAASAEVVKNDWFYTGDVGYTDEDGYLIITDRKKDIIVTAGGKNIAPQKIENQLKAFPLISQAVVIGDKKPYLTALLTPNEEKIGKLTPAKKKALKTDIEGIIKKVNSNLAQYETIKKYTLLDSDFSIETGELTPTLKVKRKVVSERYKAEIEKMYAK